MAVEFEVVRVDWTMPGETPGSKPRIHCFGYTPEGEWTHATIYGFEPYFYVRYEDAKADAPDAIRRFELYDSDGSEFTSVRGERLARAYTRTPNEVRTARDEFKRTWESDVSFADRFIIDVGVKTGLRVPHTDHPVPVSSVEPCAVDAEWRVHMLDIEVEDRHGFPEDGEEPILCLTSYDSFTDEYILWIHGVDRAVTDHDYAVSLHEASVSVRWFDTERAMLQSYLAYLSGSRPSVIAGWNLDGFDAPYLIDRCTVLNNAADVDTPTLAVASMSPLYDASNHPYFGPRVKGIVLFDLLRAFKQTQFTRMDSYRLDAVADELFGEGKETFVGRVGDLYDEDPVKLLEYNLRDVELCVEIDRRQQLLAFWREVKSFVGCQLADAMIPSTAADRYVLNDGYGEYVLPRKQVGDTEKFAGATVFEPIEGIREWVPVFDVASLYPMSMYTLNASPETKVTDTYTGETRRAPDGTQFRTDTDSIMRTIIDELLEERQAKKDERDAFAPSSEEYAVRDRQQTAIKVIMNTLYGVMSWPKFRLYDVDVATATTSTGRALLEWTGDRVHELGYDVIYGDTDSVLVGNVLNSSLSGSPDGADDSDTPDNPEEWTDDEAVERLLTVCRDIEAALNESYDAFAAEVLGAPDGDHRFEIEFEKLYRRFFQAARKKRYAGHEIWKEGKRTDAVSISGFEFKRSDSSKLTKRVQEETLQRIVTGEPIEDVVAYVREQSERFDRREVSIAELGIPMGVSKPLNEYDIDTHSVRGAKYGNLLLGTSFSSGSKPKRYYLDSVHPAFYDRIEAEVGLDPARDGMYAAFIENPFVIAVDQPAQLPAEVSLDWNTMKRKTLRGAVKDILSALDVSWDELESGQRQASLTSFDTTEP